MSVRNKSSLAPKVLTHLDVKDHVTRDLLITWWQFGDIFLPDFECRTYVLHFLPDSIAPKRVAVLLVELQRLRNVLGNFDAELVGSYPILGIDLADYAVTLT